MRALLIAAFVAGCAAPAAAPPRPFVIRVVDRDTNRGVPLVELRTTNGIVLHTDNAGVVAVDEPGLLGARVYFFVQSAGYEHAADGFNYRGAALDTRAGGEATVAIRRLNIAERLYRITGQGLFHHSERAGLPAPPRANGEVLGQDTTMAVVHRGRVRWFWGDTLRASYPLGHFGTATATSPLPADAAAGIEFTYSVDDNGFSRPAFDLKAPGPVWVHGTFVLDDAILTTYERMKDLGTRLEVGIAEFDEPSQRFRPLVQFALDEDRVPHGQSFRHGEHVYFALPYPLLRVRARREDVLDPKRYEALTAAGEWRAGARPLKADDVRTVDATTGARIRLHRGSVRWNDYRKRWVMIAVRVGGETSYLGDVYYAESERVEGPWARAVKVASHPKYSFYNPVHHAFLDREGGRVIHFEGTYATSFSGAPVATPRYDYNQLMYRLDLGDARLR